MRSVLKVSTTARVNFTVYDSSDAVVTGLVDGGFTKRLAKDGANDATTVTIAEIGNGRYTATFTPASTGNWYLLIFHATYNPRGWDETFDVTTDGVPTVAAIQSGLATSSALATVQADTDDIQTRLPAALVSGRMDASVGSMAANVLTATAIASDAITAAKIADAAIDAATFAAGAINAAAIATDAIDADAIKADAVTEIQSGLATAAALATVQADTDDIQTRLPAALVSGKMSSHVVTIATDAVDAAALKADAVTEMQAGLSTAAALASVASDATAIKAKTDLIPAGGPPAATDYTSARAAKLDNLDATVSSRLAGASYTAPDNTDIVAIKAKTDALPASPANETTLAAVKAKTDNLPSDPADESLVIAATDAIMARLGSPALASLSADAAANVAAIIARLPAALVGGKMDAVLSAGERNAIATALLDLADAIDTGYTPRAALRLMAGAAAGEVSGVQTGSPVFKSLDGSKDRIAATVDTNNNRTSVIHDIT